MTLTWIHHAFSHGLAHPFTGLDHLVAMLAVGVWSAQTTATWRERLRAPLVFASLLLAGAFVGAAGAVPSLLEPAIAASLLVLGLLVGLRRGLPPVAGALLVGGFALVHGLAHGHELGDGAALAGMVLATALLHAGGLLIGHALQARHRGWSHAAGVATGLLGAVLLFA